MVNRFWTRNFVQTFEPAIGFIIMNFKVIATVIGIGLLLLGFFALVLSFVGVKLSYLLWLDSAGALAGFVLRLVMIILGGVLVTLAQTDWEKERKIPAPEEQKPS